MPRTYARIAVTRGANDDWRALSWAEQGVYDFLLTHPKLSLCGVLDVKSRVWRAGSNDDAIEGYLDSLEDTNFVLWDRDTDEIAIRTFVRHDGVLANRNLGRGMWSAWSSIESEELRIWLVDNFPGTAMEPRFQPPETALRIHGRNHPSEPGSAAVDRTSSALAQPQPSLHPASAGNDARFTPTFKRDAGDNPASDGARINGSTPVMAGTTDTYKENP